MKIELNKVYRARNGTQWKVVGILYPRGNDSILIVNQASDDYEFVDSSGIYISDSIQDELDLVELIGDDFIEEKKPRYFEFEGWIGESPAETINIHPSFILNKVFGYDVSSFVDNKAFLDRHRSKTSKWKVTMQEIIE